MPSVLIVSQRNAVSSFGPYFDALIYYSQAVLTRLIQRLTSLA